VNNFPTLDAALRPALAEIERQHLKRVRRTVEGFGETAGSAEVVVGGRRLINFCGNDYLGLARHPVIAETLGRAAARWGVGSGAAHMVTGHSFEHARLEEELAAYVRRERALLFSAGYMANLAAVTAFAGRGDLVLLDRLSHASLIDGAMLSGARVQRYPHAAAQAAEHRLTTSRKHRACVLATDGVFSMDGDIAPVTELAAVAAAHETWLLVDDAHGLGVIGPTGRGTLEQLGASAAAVPILMGTLGKAFGTFGAFIAGSAAVIEFLMQRARSYIYTTALPPALAAATRAALALSERESWRRERVLALTVRFRAAAQKRGIPLAPSGTPIQPIVLGDARAALAASAALFEAGFWVAAIRPPTVPRSASRLRLTLSAAHSEADVDALVDALHLCLGLRNSEVSACRPIDFDEASLR